MLTSITGNILGAAALKMTLLGVMGANQNTDRAVRVRGSFIENSSLTDTDWHLTPPHFGHFTAHA